MQELWTCPDCGRGFANRNQSHACAPLRGVDELFAGTDPQVRAAFDQVLAAARAIGPVRVLPEQTRVALQVRMSFAAFMPRRHWLNGHLVLASRVDSPRFTRIDVISARNIVHAFRLTSAAEVDAEFLGWLAAAYRVGAQQHLGRGEPPADGVLVSGPGAAGHPDPPVAGAGPAPRYGPTVSRGVLLVTGGGRGIGAAVARQAARAGWAVVLTYRADESAAAAVVAEIEARGGTASAVAADIAREADVLAAFAAADRAGPLRALVANAGIIAPKSRLDEVTAERVERILAVNVLGTILCCREAVRRLSTAHGGPGGSIVLISSAASRIGSAGEYIDYAASKGAVDTLGIGLAREVATEGVRVNVVRPGVVDTDIHASGNQPDRAKRLGPSIPLGRAGQPDEVAAAVMWLLSSDASYCTGSIFDVAGGL